MVLPFLQSRLTASLRFIKKHWVISLILFVVLLVTVFFVRPKQPKEIATEKVKRSKIVQSVSITGTVTAERYADLTFQIPGKLSTLNVKKGDSVKKGQVIATLDQQTALKNLRTALLNYSIQRNTFEQTYKNQPVEKPSDALNDTMRRLLENNQYNLDLTVNSVELQELARQQSVLTAPIEGIVTRADAKIPGVNITTTATFSIVDPQSITFKMEVDEADIAKIREGQLVDVTLDAYPERVLRLQVDSIDFVTHTTSTGGSAYDVKAVMPENANFDYRVGMGGNASIITRQKFNTIAIPLSSIVDDTYVYVKKQDTFIKKKVKLGIQSDTETEVVEGLSEGELLVSDPTAVPSQKK